MCIAQDKHRGKAAASASGFLLPDPSHSSSKTTASSSSVASTTKMTLKSLMLSSSMASNRLQQELQLPQLQTTSSQEQSNGACCCDDTIATAATVTTSASVDESFQQQLNPTPSRDTIPDDSRDDHDDIEDVVMLSHVPSLDDEEMSFIDIPVDGLITLPREHHHHPEQELLYPRAEKEDDEMKMSPRNQPQSSPRCGGLHIEIFKSSSPPEFPEESYRTPKSTAGLCNYSSLSPPPTPKGHRHCCVIHFDDDERPIPQHLYLPDLSTASS